ncbi:MAG: FAD-binding protein [Bacteroidales bacterium]|nr:FAD-binding protein [Bacteroidales bacterium]
MFTLYTDPLHRIAYATDASAYREVPEAVTYPKNEQDIVNLTQTARERQTHLIPRAGGTSIAGQVVGSGIVVDISKHFKKILEINKEERWARVQSGVVLDELNLALEPYGLFFSPETSTSNRCCIGGMFGNNSCGSHSLIYGSTRHHVLEARGVLCDGSIEMFKEYTIKELEERFGPHFWETDRLDHSEQGFAGLQSISGQFQQTSLIQSIYSQLINWALDEKTVQLIEENYPDKSLRRRSCGYAIDEVIEDLHNTAKQLEERTINLCKVLAGSEGTLAFITEIKVDLDPLPPKEKMVVCAHCDTLQKSFLGNLVALKFHPSAVELMDRNILELSKQNVEQQKNRFFVQGDPAAILIIELRGETRAEIDAVADQLENALIENEEHLVYACSRVYGSEISKVWSLRKAGLGLLTGMKGDAKPIGVIEDTAVAPEKLPAYMADFAQMLENLGLSCVYHAHISTGELHLRPIINIKEAEGKRKFREVAFQTALLVKKYKGSLSGEHGDGRLRGEFIQLLYGDEVYALMQDLKKCWDPMQVFNLHKIVDTLPMDSMLRFDVGQQYAIEKVIGKGKTYYNWKAAFDECKVEGATGAKNQLHALMCSIEQCNGAGDCRKSNLIGGTLCPAFKVSGDETKATRARANVLREILTRGWESEAFTVANCIPQFKKGNSSKCETQFATMKSILKSKELAEVLDSCLACKGCHSECPSNVDMTRLRSEILQQKYNVSAMPLRSFAVSYMATVEQLGHIVWPLYNLFASWKFSSNIIKNIIKFASERDIPTLSRVTMRTAVKRESQQHKRQATKGKVYLFADEFTNFQEAELGLTFAKLLLHLGYEVEIPNHVESGRAAMSKGNLNLAKKFALKNVNLLKVKVTAQTPLVGIEPSCILSFRDEYPDLVPVELRKEAKALGSNALLFDEFIMREVAAGRINAEDFKMDTVEIWLHGHCHQKALVGTEKTVAMLKLLKGSNVHVIPSGCCGMAGSFGYEKEHYKTSLAIGEMVLFPTIRKAISNTDGVVPCIVSAPGTSCRQQILDGTGVHAVHPIEILYRWVK